MKESISQTVITIILLCIAAINIYAIINCGPTKEVTEEQRLRKELEEVTRERDLLSDAIRCHIDATNGDCDILVDVRHFLRVNNEDLTNFDQWSYCY